MPWTDSNGMLGLDGTQVRRRTHLRYNCEGLGTLSTRRIHVQYVHPRICSISRVRRQDSQKPRTPSNLIPFSVTVSQFLCTALSHVGAVRIPSHHACRALHHTYETEFAIYQSQVRNALPACAQLLACGSRINLFRKPRTKI